MVKLKCFLSLLASTLVLAAIPAYADEGKPDQSGAQSQAQSQSQSQSTQPTQAVQQPAATQQNVTPGQPEQGTVQQGAQQAAQDLPADMPKMLIIRVTHDKSGAEQEAIIFPLNEVVKVDNDQVAQQIALSCENEQGITIQEDVVPLGVPAAVEQTFQSAEQGSVAQPATWLARWNFYNPARNIYGYGYRPYYGYAYPHYYGNYGYYYNGGLYPYSYYPYYYPNGAYNYYYYYNPYYYPY